jgi:carboxyl-terminal processing protease
MRARWSGLALGIVLLVAFVGGSQLLRRGFGPEARPEGSRLFEQVFAHVRDRYVDSLDAGALYARAASGLLRELGDPYSTYLDSARLERVEQSTSGLYGGLGIEFDVRDGWMTVVAALPNSPAETIGLRPGDRVVRIDDRETRGWTNDEVRRALRGNPGSNVTLVVERPGVPGRQDYQLQRQQVLVRPVQRTMLLDAGIGYVQVRAFSDSAAIELAQAVDSLNAAGMRALILDLRGNPGGLLQQGAEVAGLFLDEGQEIVALRGRGAEGTRVFSDSTPQRWPSLRVVVLVDRASASASEIVAGALQDHDRALIVGRPTYGKGSAQSVFSFNGADGGVKLTTARWYTPSGRSLEPDPVSPSGDGFAIDDEPPARPVFRTDAGREVLGGGGIVPDVLAGDTVPPTGPRILFAALGRQLPRLRDAITEEAMALTSRGQVTGWDATLPEAARTAVRRRLEARGVLVPEAAWAAGAEWVARQLGNEAVRYALGRAEETRRIVSRDPVVQEARTRLRQAADMAALLRTPTP